MLYFPVASCSFDQFLFAPNDFQMVANKPNVNSSNMSMNDQIEEDYDSVDSDNSDGDDKKRKRPRQQQRHMTEEQRVERRYLVLRSFFGFLYFVSPLTTMLTLCRERNREHAKRSRVRKKFLLESLQQSVSALRGENEKLKAAIRENLSDEADLLLAESTKPSSSCVATDPQHATRTLDDPDYSLVKALQIAQQNFVITDPSIPDNPIVFASQGFLTLTGYTLDQVLGRNCRFLQGPDTDPRAVDRIRKGIEKGEDTTVVLLNYRVDGTTFWNQFFVAALRDGEGAIVNYLGVQCKVSEDYAQAFGRTEDSKLVK